MSDWGSLNGTRIVGGSIAIPLYGIPVADISLATTNIVADGPGQATLTIGNLSLTMTVYRQITFAGTTTARLLGGFGGWHTPVQARAYNNPGGLLLSTILGDCAIEVGEKVSVLVDGAVGSFFVRFADKASRVLRTMAGPEWWIAPSGVTTVGVRPTTTIASANFTVEAFDGRVGLGQIATEDLASWAPGAQYQNSILNSTQVISSVRIDLRNDGRVRLMVASQ